MSSVFGCEVLGSGHLGPTHLEIASMTCPNGGLLPPYCFGPPHCKNIFPRDVPICMPLALADVGQMAPLPKYGLWVTMPPIRLPTSAVLPARLSALLSWLSPTPGALGLLNIADAPVDGLQDLLTGL